MDINDIKDEIPVPALRTGGIVTRLGLAFVRMDCHPIPEGVDLSKNGPINIEINGNISDEDLKKAIAEAVSKALEFRKF